ncbi:hypothetical protein ACLOJK_019725 [Asimina triloba]
MARDPPPSETSMTASSRNHTIKQRRAEQQQANDPVSTHHAQIAEQPQSVGHGNPHKSAATLSHTYPSNPSRRQHRSKAGRSPTATPAA